MSLPGLHRPHRTLTPRFLLGSPSGGLHSDRLKRFEKFFQKNLQEAKLSHPLKLARTKLGRFNRELQR